MDGFLNKNDKGQGGMGIFALSSSSRRAEKQGREGGSPAAARAGGVQGRRPGARERLWSEGKKRGRREGPIPSLTLDWDAARRRGSGGVRRPAEASVAAVQEARR